MIRFEHVGKRYPNGREALSDLSLNVGAGEMVFLTGHSGAGKSTVLKLIALIETGSVEEAVAHWRLHLRNAIATWTADGEGARVVDSLSN